MNTIILMWNPVVSSLSYREYKDLFRDPEVAVLNWSIHDWKKAHAGDRFFLVRVGKEGAHGKGNGIVMSGYLNSELYRGTDWSGKGREVFYADLQPEYMFDTEKVTTLTDDLLTQAIPGSDWTGGHSGRVPPAAESRVLEDCWARAVQGLEGVLTDGHKWSVARDEFRKARLLVLHNAHFKGESHYIQAEFYRGWLDVSSFIDMLYQQDDELLPGAPETPSWDEVESYRIRLSDLRQAFGVENDREVAVVLCQQYMGADAKKLLLEFARAAGCGVKESFVLFD